MYTSYPIFQVDAFTDKLFGGNPAAVVPLGTWLSDARMQAIAAENNLAETAFLVPNGPDYSLRWFTPELEIDLCGHATLASAYVVHCHLGYDPSTIVFHTRSGPLTVSRLTDNRWQMDFPARPPQPVDNTMKAAVTEALGKSPIWVGKSRDILAVFESEAEVAALTPHFEKVAALDCIGVIASAPGRKPEIDFVSRFFAPQAGVPEDPVTGSAHTTLIPYWADKLGKRKLIAHQISQRLGVLNCTHRGERVDMSGQAVLYLKGEIRA